MQRSAGTFCVTALVLACGCPEEYDNEHKALPVRQTPQILLLHYIRGAKKNN